MIYRYRHLFAKISPVRDPAHKTLFWRFAVFYEDSETAMLKGVRADSRSALAAASDAIDRLIQQQSSSLAA